jgi:pyruvate dehydrogenase E2 component (dihydrolipoamide acetyltransferase)/2-oxoglutarate dehydrogenase E2 component (dihydrolipoamide succinyltransferase)
MAVHIAIPKLGMTMNEATIVGWMVSEGDWVEEHQVLLEIETEKVSYKVEARASGFVHILVEKDKKVRVGQVVGLLAKSKEELDALQKEPPKEMHITDAEPRELAPVDGPSPRVASTEEREHVRISPVARRMAEEHMIDITSVTGTGPEGRIVKEDIEKAIEAKKAKGTAVEPEVKAGTVPCLEVYDFKRVKTTIPLKGMRKTMAEHMLRSLSVAAQLTDMGEIDMMEVVKFRNNLLQREKMLGSRITFTDIFVLAIARALKDNPIINSSIIGNEIKLWEDINIGVAVAIEEDGFDGLMVPVVKNADKKSLSEINKELRALIEKARSGKLMPDDVSGGTFTLTNIGAFGGMLSYSTPIINQPQSAILHTAPITDRPVAREGQIVVRPIMTYNFTYDHRVIVGAVAGRFMARVTELLEYPSLLFI